MHTNSVTSTVAALIEEARRNPVRWLIEDILLDGGVHVLHGKEETFKTMLTLQMHEALTNGGMFLNRPVQGGIRTGIAQLETKGRLFGGRLAKVFKGEIPNIYVLPEHLRFEVLSARQAQDRIRVIADWAENERLKIVSIDSAVKLFPPGCDLNKADLASDVFNQLQRTATVWLLAHNRKALPGAPTAGSDEIVGSGRFAQDPDIVHQMIRPDARAPKVIFNWGKVRDGEKHSPLELWFDRHDFRLHPIHPYIHLLRDGERSEEQLVTEADLRFGWKDRRAREYIASLKTLRTSQGQMAVIERQEGHKKFIALQGDPVPQTDETGDAALGDPKT